MSPGEVDVVVIRRHLAALREAVRVLKRHTGRPIEQLETDNEEQWTVERGLHLCAQNALDIATHIAAGEGRDVPDYASAIVELGRLGALKGSFAKEFSSVAGFRNVLVHGYLEVDLALLHRLLNERLEDFEFFATAIEEYLGRM
jgi:uncharacterized protein YutE (UPF0331/DUF86 family)